MEEPNSAPLDTVGMGLDHPDGSGGERRVIERIRSVLPVPPDEEIWIGDDSAVVVSPSGKLLLTVDMSVCGVHADLDLIGLDDLGWRALAGAVSDIGAMGGRPEHALVALSAPPGTDIDLLYSGIASSAVEHGVFVVGGDLSVADQVVVAVTVTGSLDPGRTSVTRSGASPGDLLFVTGPLGASAAGLRVLRERAAGHIPGGLSAESSGDNSGELRMGNALIEAHCRPRARLREGIAALRAGATAMIDVSDGLAIDLDRLASASEVGARLDGVPVFSGSTLDEALGGGEDYELVIATSDPDRLVAVFESEGLPFPLPIGICTSDPSERTFKGAPMPIVGWEHPLG